MTHATLHTNHGAIAVELFDEDAPNTVANFVKLAKDGFYDGVIFHRVIPDFMIQGGDPTGTGTGGPGYTFEDEFNQHKVERGALAMANAGPNTNGSQFFVVTTQAAPWLDGKHTVFGQVTEGMDAIDPDDRAAGHLGEGECLHLGQGVTGQRRLVAALRAPGPLGARGRGKAAGGRRARARARARTARGAGDPVAPDSDARDDRGGHCQA